MRYQAVNKVISIFGIFGLLMVVAVNAIAGNSNYVHYSLLLTSGSGNPWAIPEEEDSYPMYQQPQEYNRQQYSGDAESGQDYRQNSQQGRYPGRQYRNYQQQGSQFITEEFLRSLEQQQSRFQVMPENRHVPRQSAPAQPGSGLPPSNIYSYPTKEMNYIDPLYRAPVITPWSPWGIGVSDW